MSRISKFFHSFYGLLERKTSTTTFIPQIDGLRFLAIAMVVLYHLNIFVVAKIPFVFSRIPQSYWFFSFLDSDKKGVFLFFVISGFILALPFAKAARGEGKQVKIKEYFLRRLTRLEPPYFLVMVACYIGIVVLPGHDFSQMFNKSFSGLFPSLATSLVYMHNILMPHNMSVNPVAWSLEIEIQFYILVPLLTKIYNLQKKKRWLILIAMIIIFVFLQNLYKPTTLTLYNYIQYFLLGFLLVDLYLSGYKIKHSALLTIPLGLLCLAFILSANLLKHPSLDYLFIPAIFVLYSLVLLENIWGKVFSWKFFTAIGGMCYSIYLLHYNIIPVIGNKTIFYNISYNYPVTYIWHAIVLIVFILFFSTIFYLLIEKPCMDKEWPRKLWNFIKLKLV